MPLPERGRPRQGKHVERACGGRSAAFPRQLRTPRRQRNAVRGGLGRSRRYYGEEGGKEWKVERGGENSLPRYLGGKTARVHFHPP